MPGGRFLAAGRGRADKNGVVFEPRGDRGRVGTCRIDEDDASTIGVAVSFDVGHRRVDPVDTNVAAGVMGVVGNAEFRQYSRCGCDFASQQHGFMMVFLVCQRRSRGRFGEISELRNSHPTQRVGL